MDYGMHYEGVGQPGPGPNQAGESSSARGDGRAQKIFLGGLAWDTDEGKLREYFSKFGAIEEVIVIRDRMTSRPRGFGFITFKDRNVAELVLLHAHSLDGRKIEVKHATPHTPKSKKIFVGGLAPETTEDEFRNHFQQYGQVVEAQIMLDHISGRSRGFGFVTFDSEDAVEKVFKAGHIHQIAGKRVEVKNATPKGSGPVGMRPEYPGGQVPMRGGAGPYQGRYPQVPMPPMYPPMPPMPMHGAYPYPYHGYAYPPHMGYSYMGYSYPTVPYGYPGARYPGHMQHGGGQQGSQSNSQSGSQHYGSRPNSQQPPQVPQGAQYGGHSGHGMGGQYPQGGMGSSRGNRR